MAADPTRGVLVAGLVRGHGELSIGATGRGRGERRYEIVEKLDRGGMGELFVARLHEPGRPTAAVAIKRLLPQLIDDPDYVAMFVAEVEVMSALDHPNVVRVLDTPQFDGAACLALEFVRGRSVHQVIERAGARRARLPPLFALRVMRDALRGLEHAHTFRLPDGTPLNLVHRDVTPGNILVSFSGEVKLTDFGIAKSRMSLVSTTAGVLKGKARYLSPEQIRGAVATPRSDIFAAACVLVEMLTGVAIFEHGSVPRTLYAIVHGEVPDLDRELAFAPPALRQLLARALQIDPAARLEDARAFAEGLEDAARRLGGPLEPADIGAFMRQLFGETDANDAETSAEESVWSSGSGDVGASMVTPHAPQPAVQAGSAGRAPVGSPRDRVGSPLGPEPRGPPTARERPPPDAKLATGSGEAGAGTGAPARVVTPREAAVTLDQGNPTEKHDAVPTDGAVLALPPPPAPRAAPAASEAPVAIATLDEDGASDGAGFGTLPELGSAGPLAPIPPPAGPASPPSSTGAEASVEDVLSVLAWLQTRGEGSSAALSVSGTIPSVPSVRARAAPAPSRVPLLFAAGVALGVLATLGMQSFLAHLAPEPGVVPRAPIGASAEHGMARRIDGSGASPRLTAREPRPELPPETTGPGYPARTSSSATSGRGDLGAIDLLEPRGARVSVDGVVLEQRVPIRDLPLASGWHELRIVKGRGRRARAADEVGLGFSLEPGERLDLTRRLRRHLPPR